MNREVIENNYLKKLKFKVLKYGIIEIKMNIPIKYKSKKAKKIIYYRLKKNIIFKLNIIY